MNDEKCAVEVWDNWRSYVCGRPIKRDGMCGVHARSAEQRKAKDIKRELGRVAGAALVQRLARHGVDARVYYDGTVTLAMTLDALADLLDRNEESA